jgi:hypothetical protein
MVLNLDGQHRLVGMVREQQEISEHINAILFVLTQCYVLLLSNFKCVW